MLPYLALAVYDVADELILLVTAVGLPATAAGVAAAASQYDVLFGLREKSLCSAQ